MSRPAAFLAAAAAALACATPVAPLPQSRLAVEVLHGFSRRPEPPPLHPERVEILIDATSSMRARTEVGPGRFVAAREAASRLVRALPGETSIGLHAVGIAPEGECSPAFRLAHSGAGESRDALVEQIEKLTPRSEGSLARAVEALRVYLAATQTLVRARVLIITDLGDECGGDLCGAVHTLVAWGARVEFAVFGDAPVPPCIADFAPTASWQTTGGKGAIRPVRFEVETYDREGGREPVAVAEGWADGTPVVVPAGVGSVVVKLEPPLRIEPLVLAPSAITRLRVLDFPALATPVREWSAETAAWEPEAGDATSGGGAASP